MSASTVDEPLAGIRIPHRPPWRRPSKKLLIGGGAALVLLGAIVSAALSGGSSPGSTHATSSGVSPNGSVTGQASAAGSTGPSASGDGATKAASPLLAPSESPSAVPASLPSKIVKDGSVDLQVPKGRVGSVVGHLTSLVTGDGGFVASTSQSTGNGAPATGDLTLRVPAANFEVLLNQVRGLGTPLTVDTSSQDVTAQSVDLQARLQALRDTRTQFEQILARAQTIGDILSVESQITDLQTQIDQLQGQLNVMTDQATYGTLSVHVEEAGAVSPHPRAASGLGKAWDHARHSFAAGLEAVLAALGGIAVFLVVAGGILGLGWSVWSLARRRPARPVQET